jgi:hypothetical protein
VKSILGTFRLYDTDGKGKDRELISFGPRVLLPGDTMEMGDVQFHIPLSLDDPELPGGDQFWFKGRIAFTWEENL